jgi:SAM-dependent methyltransferase
MDIRSDTDALSIATALGVASRLRVVCWNATELDKWRESGSFDLIICRSALHHLANPARVLRAMTRRLRPGGHLLLSDAFFPDYSALIWSALNHIREADFVAYYTYQAILDMVSQAGLQIELIRPYTFVHEDIDAYLFPAAPSAREALKRAFNQLDERTKREMKLRVAEGGVRFEYACFDLIAANQWRPARTEGEET